MNFSTTFKLIEMHLYKAAVPSVSMPLEQFSLIYIFIISIIVMFVLEYTHTESCLLLIYPCFFITLMCQ